MRNEKTMQIRPVSMWEGYPCSYVAIGCAGANAENIPVKRDGYATLKDINTAIRKVLDVKKYNYIAKAERIRLKDFMKEKTEGRAIIVVLGHCIYADFSQNCYWSFFDNLEDKVVAVWYLR